MSDFPILDAIERAEAIRAGQARADQAMAKAEESEPGFKALALEAVRRHALRVERFLAEHVTLPPLPSGRKRNGVMGSLMPEAVRRGWVAADGFAIDSHGSPKTAWKSLIVGGAA